MTSLRTAEARAGPGRTRSPVPRWLPWALVVPLAIAAAILGFAGPILNPEPREGRTGALVIVTDRTGDGAPESAAGAAAAQQTVLEHMFGSAAATRLAQTARKDLADRLGTALRKEAQRFHVVVEDAIDPLDLAATLEAQADAMTSSARELGYG